MEKYFFSKWCIKTRCLVFSYNVKNSFVYLYLFLLWKMTANQLFTSNQCRKWLIMIFDFIYYNRHFFHFSLLLPGIWNDQKLLNRPPQPVWTSSSPSLVHFLLSEYIERTLCTVGENLFKNVVAPNMHTRNRIFDYLESAKK